VITGSAGTGKNFVAMEVLVDTLAKGGTGAILDMGQSYRHHVLALGGKAVDLNEASPISVNPFSLLGDASDLAEIQPALVDMVLTLAFGTSSADEWSARVLTSAAVDAAYGAAGADASLQTLIDWLSTRDEADAARLVDRLGLFVEGKYQRWFAGPSELPRSAELVVYDVQALRDTPIYGAVLNAVLTHLHLETCRADRHRKKLVLVGEADSLFEKTGGQTLEMVMRRARRVNGAYGIVSRGQNVALEQEWHSNAGLLIMLRAQPDMIDSFIAARILRPEARELARTLYGEMYVQWDDGGGVYRLLADDFSYFAFTTRHVDIRKVCDALNEGLSYVDAVARCADDAQILRDVGRLVR
jgi:hypothetical protein